MLNLRSKTRKKNICGSLAMLFCAVVVVSSIVNSETLDVVTLPTGGTDAIKNISTQIVQIPNGKTTLIRLAVRNTGDVSIYDLTVNVFPGLQSALGSGRNS
jgi:hypothetical protein